jgi:hypothetical protein
VQSGMEHPPEEWNPERRQAIGAGPSSPSFSCTIAPPWTSFWGRSTNAKGMYVTLAYVTLAYVTLALVFGGGASIDRGPEQQPCMVG